MVMQNSSSIERTPRCLTDQQLNLTYILNVLDLAATATKIYVTSYIYA